MERGDTFPAIVVVRPNASVKATPVDGNHLAKSAMLAGRESVAAYVVQGEPSFLVEVAAGCGRRAEPGNAFATALLRSRSFPNPRLDFVDIAGNLQESSAILLRHKRSSR